MLLSFTCLQYNWTPLGGLRYEFSSTHLLRKLSISFRIWSRVLLSWKWIIKFQSEERSSRIIFIITKIIKNVIIIIIIVKHHIIQGMYSFMMWILMTFKLSHMVIPTCEISKKNLSLHTKLMKKKINKNYSNIWKWISSYDNDDPWKWFFSSSSNWCGCRLSSHFI